MKNFLFSITKYSRGRITASAKSAWLGMSEAYARVFLREIRK